MRLLVALLALLLAMPAAAQSREERTRLDWTTARGQLLFDVDRAAWVTTDDMLARLAEADRPLIRGWTVERDGRGFVVTYFGGEGDARFALYRGRVENRQLVSREVFPAASRPLLTPLQRRLADAVAAGQHIQEQPCTPARFNIAVIPPATPDGPIDVYALSPQTDNNVFPFGGHYRFTIAADGTQSGKRGFMRSCFNMPRQGPGPNGEQPVGMFLSHLLDPIPTEIHVFMSLTIGMPVFVGTPDRRVWAVEGNRIRLVQR